VALCVDEGSPGQALARCEPTSPTTLHLEQDRRTGTPTTRTTNDRNLRRRTLGSDPDSPSHQRRGRSPYRRAPHASTVIDSGPCAQLAGRSDNKNILARRH
jgi:hypothetical protein